MHQAIEPPGSTDRDRNQISPGYQRLGSKTRASQTNQRPQTETVAAYSTTSGSDRVAWRNPSRMDPTPALSKPRLPAPRRLPGCALTLQTECLRLQPRLHAAFTIDNLHPLFRGCQSKLHQSDWDKCSLNSEQKRKAKFSLFTYLNT